MMMGEYVRTQASDDALAMCEAVLAGREDSRIGQITGDPGTGKSALSRWLVQELGAVRVVAYHGVAEKQLFVDIAEAMNKDGRFSVETTGGYATLFRRIKNEIGSQLLIVDEANHLKWGVLEALRGLSDQGQAGLVLVGTDILAKRLVEARVRHYLAQLRQRIGAKRIVLEVMKEPAEVTAYVIQPTFGKVSQKVAQVFLQTCGGYWRLALELSDACERLMKAEGIDALDETVVLTAGALMAGYETPKRRPRKGDAK